MAVVYKHYGTAKNGVRHYFNKPLLDMVMQDLEGKDFEMVIKEKKKKVSVEAHGYYRAGVIAECLTHETFGGWLKEEIHEFFAKMFLSYEVRERHLLKDGTTGFKIVPKIRSTSKLSSKEMWEFTEKVIRYLAMEHTIIIKSPEQYKLDNQ